jgi:hypothetical protein
MGVSRVGLLWLLAGIRGRFVIKLIESASRSMKIKISLLWIFLVILAAGCEDKKAIQGSVVTIDYRDASISGGDWVQIDSFRFKHIGKRSEAGKVKYPLPSNEVSVKLGKGRKKARDFNPKIYPTYIAKHLQKANESLKEEEKYVVMNRFLMSYKGVLKLAKKDSSRITISVSKNYSASIEINEYDVR